MAHLLSKSTYIRGRQCAKSLWLVKHRPELRPEVPARLQAIFDQGTEVGRLAQQRFPGGVDCSPEHHYDYGPALEATRAALAAAVPAIYEASFQHDGVLAALDILVRDGEGWMAVEVKSSTSVKEVYLEDAALQYHVISACGVPLTRMVVMHVDTRYVREGAIDVRQLFHLEDVTARVLARQAAVRTAVEALKGVVLAPDQPAVDIGPHCGTPYVCEFKAHCWAAVPSPSVFDLSHIGDRAWELYHAGIVRLEDLPADTALSERQHAQVEARRSGNVVVDLPRVKAFVQGLRYPLHHLDFETFATAVPLFDGLRPFQAVPFQYSLHVQQHRGAAPDHHAFLADGAGDPREAFVSALLAQVGEEGDVLAYNLSYERSILNALARDLPQHAPAIARLTARCKDLAEPFAKQWYYAPAMNGRHSIKQVLPALVPELSYDELAIGSGDLASMRFAQLMQGTYSGDVAQLRHDLLDYCGLDTLAMVKLLEVLEGTVDAEG